MKDDNIGNAGDGDPGSDEMAGDVADQQATFAEPADSERERLHAALSAERDWTSPTVTSFLVLGFVIG